MTKLLRIDASARTSRSLTRSLADTFTENWQSRHPHADVVRRDVGRNPPPIISEEWIAAAFAKTRSPEQEQLLA